MHLTTLTTPIEVTQTLTSRTNPDSVTVVTVVTTGEKEQLSFPQCCQTPSNVILKSLEAKIKLPY